MDTITTEQFVNNQKNRCAEIDAPFFMPSNGVCYACRENIVPSLIKNGNRGSELVTGCPLCFWSYCD